MRCDERLALNIMEGLEMSNKAPIYLKRSSRRGKKEKLRDILSSDMISPPLGDFRHTIHIGSGGGKDDVFGDLSFLQGKFHLLPGQQDPGLSQQQSLSARPASICGHPLSSESSPLLKNALSLPVMGDVRALTLPNFHSTSSQCQAPPPKPPRLHLDDRRLSQTPAPSSHGFHSPDKTSPTSPSTPSVSPQSQAFLQEGHAEEAEQEQPYLSHAGSLLSLHLDLGPSILDDVLQIMDKHDVGHLNGSCLHGGRQEIFT
ncbi:cdc42 effector protein 2-like [Arapaima gigas]